MAAHTRSDTTMNHLRLLPTRTRLTLTYSAIATGLLCVATPSARAASVGTPSLGAASPVGRDTAGDFHWSGHLDPQRWVRVRNLSGWIRVERSTGADVEVRGHKSWRHGDPDRVHIIMQRTGPGDGDVLVCAVWGDDTHCDEDSYESHSHHRHHWDDDDDDVNVEFTVLLPANIKVLAATVNGSVEVSGATSEVNASSVNGRVEATSQGGPVEATSVNGSVEAEMHDVSSASRLRYSSVNGSVRVTLPASLKADVDFSTVNGSVNSDFPISVSGSLEPRHMHGTINGGGVPLRI